MATMAYPLTVRSILEHGCRYFATQQMITRTPGGARRHSFAEYHGRVQRLAGALAALGVRRGDRVATLAWNHHRHLEAYLAVPCMGAVLHTVNIRLPADQLAYVINHAGDRVVLVDADLAPLLAAIRAQLHSVEHFVIMAEPGDAAADRPATASGLSPAHDYEALLAAAPDRYPWPDLDEWDPAGTCYTSATTGNPKGVVYTHRAIWLHSQVLTAVDTMAISRRDTVLPVVPMFHVNAWGLPFAAVWTGARLVLPGPRPQPTDIARLIQEERVTMSAAVPTVWMGVLQALEREPYDLSSITRIAVGGSAVPAALVRAFDRLGVRLLHAYGMTETAPLTHVAGLKPHMDGWDPERQLAVRTSQGLPVPGLERRVVDEAGRDVPWDGRSLGEVWLRGPWVAAAYDRDDQSSGTFAGGWYRTGDVGVVDPDGYLYLADRLKDLVKSGGEWISSVALENAIMSHPAVAEAAVVAVAHPRWQERPLACVVLKPGAAAGKEDVLTPVREQFPAWWVPDDVVFLAALPKTGTGKFDKKVLRANHGGHYKARPDGDV